MIKAPWFGVSVRSRRLLAEGQEPGGDARGRGGVELRAESIREIWALNVDHAD
jgi:hypothetical protein